MLRHAQKISHNISQTCRFFGICRAQYYIWLRRFEKNGMEGLRDRSRRPSMIRYRIPPEVIALILRIREERRYGAVRRVSIFSVLPGLRVADHYPEDLPPSPCQQCFAKEIPSWAQTASRRARSSSRAWGELGSGSISSPLLTKRRATVCCASTITTTHARRWPSWKPGEASSSGHQTNTFTFDDECSGQYENSNSAVKKIPKLTKRFRRRWGVRRHFDSPRHTRQTPSRKSVKDIVSEPSRGYCAANLGGGAGAGLLNLAASIGTFGCTAVSCVVDCPSVQVTVQRKGILIPATRR